MSEVLIRRQGRAGRITLNRPKALNALTWDMCLAIKAALDRWRDDADVAVVVIDGAGEKAFCAGGDIAEMYRTASTGDFGYGRRFWADEYAMNVAIAEFPKPFVAFTQGFTMGGGVGVSAHGSHRIVGETSKVSMPECSIGLVPDVGGTLLLARAPGHLGEYIGSTGYRLGAGDAIVTGFADLYIPEEDWPGLIADIEGSGGVTALADAARPAPDAPLAAYESEIARHFSLPSLKDVAASLERGDTTFAEATAGTLRRQSPLAAACTHEAIRRVRGRGIREALETEFRFTWRAAEHGDFVEGIRAAIIDRDKTPHWRHASLEEVTEDEIAAMLASLGANELQL